MYRDFGVNPVNLTKPHQGYRCNGSPLSTDSGTSGDLKTAAPDRSSPGLRLPAYRRMPGNAADSTGPSELSFRVAGESWDFRVVVPVRHNPN